MHKNILKEKKKKGDINVHFSMPRLLSNDPTDVSR